MVNLAVGRVAIDHLDEVRRSGKIPSALECSLKRMGLLVQSSVGNEGTEFRLSRRLTDSVPDTVEFVSDDVANASGDPRPASFVEGAN